MSSMDLFWAEVNLHIHDKTRVIAEVMANKSGKAYGDFEHEEKRKRLINRVEDLKNECP